MPGNGYNPCFTNNEAVKAVSYGERSRLSAVDWSTQFVDKQNSCQVFRNWGMDGYYDMKIPFIAPDARDGSCFGSLWSLKIMPCDQSRTQKRPIISCFSLTIKGRLHCQDRYLRLCRKIVYTLLRAG